MRDLSKGKGNKKKGADWKPDEKLTMVIKKGADWKPDEKLTMKFQETFKKKKKDTKE